MGFLHDIKRAGVTAVQVVETIRRGRMSSPHFGGGAAQVTQTPFGSTTYVPPPPPPFIHRTGIILANGGSADFPNYTDERYYVRLGSIASAAAPQTDVVVVSPENGTKPTDNVVTVTNVAEARAHTHWLPAGLPVSFFRVTDADNGDRWVMQVSPAVLRPVILAVDGGDEGTVDAQCTFTYAAVDEDTAEVLGTGLSPVFHWRIRKMVAASRGLVKFEAGVCKLQFANEHYPAAEKCEEEP